MKKRRPDSSAAVFDEDCAEAELQGMERSWSWKVSQVEENVKQAQKLVQVDALEILCNTL